MIGAKTLRRLPSHVSQGLGWTVRVGIPPAATFAVLLVTIAFTVFALASLLPGDSEVIGAIALLVLFSVFIPLFVWMMVVGLNQVPTDPQTVTRGQRLQFFGILIVLLVYNVYSMLTH